MLSDYVDITEIILSLFSNTVFSAKQMFYNSWKHGREYKESSRLGGGNVEDKVEGAGGVYFDSFTFFHPWTLFFKYVLLWASHLTSVT